MSFVYCRPTKRKTKKKTKAQIEAEIQHKKELDKIAFKHRKLHQRQSSKKEEAIKLPQVPSDRQAYYPSVMSGGTPTSTSKNSIMDKLHLESAEVSDAILRKSKSISIPFNKGAYQFISDESDIQYIGKKS